MVPCELDGTINPSKSYAMSSVCVLHESMQKKALIIHASTVDCLIPLGVGKQGLESVFESLYYFKLRVCCSGMFGNGVSGARLQAWELRVEGLRVRNEGFQSHVEVMGIWIVFGVEGMKNQTPSPKPKKLEMPACVFDPVVNLWSKLAASQLM